MYQEGDGKVKNTDEIKGISYIGRPKSNTAVFVVKRVEYLIEELYKVDGCMVFAEDSIDIPEDLKNRHIFKMSKYPQKEYSEFAGELYRKKAGADRKRKYTLTEGGFFLGENVTLGDNTYIAPGCMIGHDVVIGENAEIYANAVIKNAVIGRDFILREGGVVGSDGFTFTKDENGDWLRTPSMGGVVIGNDVEIGVNTCIAQGTADHTYIGDHVKMDALVYVGHDARIMANTEISAGGIVGGYVETGEYTSVGFNASIRNRLIIGDNNVIGMGAVVTHGTEAGKVYVGNPAHLLIKEDMTS